MTAGFATVETDRPTVATSESAKTAGRPGNTTGREVISSWSFANVTIDPANETEPTAIVKAVAARTNQLTPSGESATGSWASARDR